MKFLKRLTVWLVLIVNVTVWYGPSAHASLKDTLAELGGGIKTNDAGRYSSSTRNVQTMGGMSMRFPVRGSTISLIAITPAGYSVGCGGISAWFGGFSYVNGDQVKQWLTKLGQGAVAYAFKMAIKALCPICEAVLATLEKLAQFAAKLSMDACSAGTMLAAQAGDMFSTKSQEAKRPVCGKMVTGQNKSDDMISAMDSFCSNLNTAGKAIDEFKRTKTDPNDPSVSLDWGLGNQTWLVLRGMRLAGKEAIAGATTKNTAGSASAEPYYPRLWHGHLLMNMVGAYVRSADGTATQCDASGGKWIPSVSGATTGSGSSTSTSSTSTSSTSAGDKTKPVKEDPGCYYPPTLTAKSLWGFMMCGGREVTLPSTDASNTVVLAANSPSSTAQLPAGLGKAVADYCKAMASSDTSDMWACAKKSTGGAASSGTVSGDSPYADELCAEPTTVPYVTLKKELLGNSSDDGYILYVFGLLADAVTRIVNNQALSAEQIALMDRTSYPVYQLLATAAVYPDAAMASVTELSVIIAQALVMDELRLMSNSLGKASAMKTAAGAEVTSRILTALTSINDFNAQSLSITRTETDLQTKLYAHISEINKRIQNSVLGPNLLANERLATSLAKRVTKLPQTPPPASGTPSASATSTSKE